MQQFAFTIIDGRGRVKVYEMATSEAEAKLRLQRRFPDKRIEPDHDIPEFLRERRAAPRRKVA
jgi:hypothetical protein